MSPLRRGLTKKAPYKAAWDLGLAQALLGEHLCAGGYAWRAARNASGEVWADDIKNQAPPEPDDAFNAI